MTFGEIDHADIGMTAGRVYVHKRNVEHGVSLAQGDVVSFYLYSDDQGLGAECCQVDQGAPCSLRADADEFVPSCPSRPPSWNMSAMEFVPMPSLTSSSLSTEAPEFVPSVLGVMNAHVPEFIPAAACSNVPPPQASITAINLAFLSDSDDESDEEPSNVSSGDFDADQESNGDDTDSSCCDISDSLQQDWTFKTSSDLHAAVLHAPWRKMSQVSLDEDSTSAGEGSDSEEELIVHCPARAPPGLGLPAAWRAPPGLSLPALVA